MKVRVMQSQTDPILITHLLYNLHGDITVKFSHTAIFFLYLLEQTVSRTTATRDA